MMQDVMIDLETLGQKPGCGIVSIGAVAFDPATGAMGEEFYALINRRSCAEAGLTEEPDTLQWWAEQSPEARKALADASLSPLPLTDALIALNLYLKQFGQVRVWGNGADFDNPILAVAYDRVGLTIGWKFWNSRCFRTLKNVHKTPEPARQGVHHNALDDALHQARWALKIFASIAADQRQERLALMTSFMKHIWGCRQS